jgi:hypothetical protein
MRLKALGVATAVALASALVFVSSASSSGYRSENIWLYADVIDEAEVVITADGRVPTGDEDTIPGDRFLSRDDLYVLGGTQEQPIPVGEPIGRNTIDCTAIEGSELAFRILCDGVIEMFGQGTIAWQAILVFSEASAGQPINVAITGGTGIFANVGGEALVHEDLEGEGGDAVYEIRLQRFNGSW